MIPNSGQYLYDANCNMTYDPSKKITVSYNPLNLPSLVEFDNNDFIEYTYTATGTKLRKTITSWKTTTGGTTDYAGQFLYQDNELSCIFTPVGRIVPMQYNDETFWKHEYNLKDHLGNTRIVFAAHPHGQPEVMQQTSYYPFGMTLQQQNFGSANNPPNKLLYNGKELQDDELAGVSLDWYDYGARMYDAQLGRWHVVDPMADIEPGWSPYRYGFNNPIYYTDPTGMIEAQLDFFDGYTINERGEIEYADDTGGKDYDVLYNKQEYEAAKKTGETNKFGNPEPDNKQIVNNTSILPALEGKGTVIAKGLSTGSINDVFSVFKFAADNSKIEWALARYDNNKYAIWTNHDIGNAIYQSVSTPKAIGLSNINASLHSHPDILPQHERSSMGEAIGGFYSRSDWGNKIAGNRPYEMSVYFPHTGNIYNISEHQISYIRNVGNDYKRFYFGTLNHR